MTPLEAMRALFGYVNRQAAWAGDARPQNEAARLVEMARPVIEKLSRNVTNKPTMVIRLTPKGESK